jgi:hypothetical protein
MLVGRWRRRSCRVTSIQTVYPGAGPHVVENQIPAVSVTMLEKSLKWRGGGSDTILVGRRRSCRVIGRKVYVRRNKKRI